LDQVSVEVQKLVRYPVQWDPGVRTAVTVGDYAGILVNEKNVFIARRCRNRESTATTLGELFERA
jgi:hypothetical protein